MFLRLGLIRFLNNRSLLEACREADGEAGSVVREALAAEINRRIAARFDVDRSR